MTDWTTIRVRQDAKEKADSMKPDGVTWSEWVADDSRAISDDLIDEFEDAVRQIVREELNE